MKTIQYTLFFLLTLVASCSYIHRVPMTQSGQSYKVTPAKMLKEASQMNLSQLAEFYKENQYIFLRDAIVQNVSSQEYSIDDLKNASNLFSYDTQIYNAIQKLITEQIIKEANNMDLSQTAEFYKENRYDILKDYIIEQISSEEYSLEELKTAESLFYYDEQIQSKLQKHIALKQASILEMVCNMDLPQLAEFYKENRYDFLGNAISESMSSLDGSIDDLEDAATLFNYDYHIFNVIQKRIEEKEEQQRKLYATIYYQNCDSLLTALEIIISNDVAQYIGELVSSTLVDNIFEDDLPEEKWEINQKANNWIKAYNNKINAKIMSLYKQFTDDEIITRRKLADKYNMSYYVRYEIDITDIVQTATEMYPHPNNTYPELYSISEKQNSTDWLGWGLTAAELISGVIPGGQPIAAGIGLFSAGRDAKNLYNYREEMKKYGTKVSEKIFNELHDESEKKIQYISNSIKYKLKLQLGI